MRRVALSVLAAVGLSFCLVSPAAARVPNAGLTVGIDGHWYGDQSTTYVYNWTTNPFHVASAYARGYHTTDGTEITAPFNYVESGIFATYLHAPQEIGAYENWPDTPDNLDHSGQQLEYGVTVAAGTWPLLKNENMTYGGCDWYGSVNGHTHVHDLHLYDGTGSRTRLPQCLPDTTAERASNDDSLPEADNSTTHGSCMRKDSTMSWSNWQWASGWYDDADNVWNVHFNSTPSWYSYQQ